MTIFIDNSDKTHDKFAYLNYDDEVFPAMRNLGEMGFKLWMYLYCKRDEDSFTYDVEDYYEKFGVDEKGYEEGEKELLNKGYLVEEKKDCFSFYTTPQGE